MSVWPGLFDTPRAARLRRRWGWPGLLGLLCLLVCAMLHALWLPGLRGELHDAQAEIGRAMRRADAQRPAMAAPALAQTAAARFQAAFPPAAERHVRLAALLALARVAEVGAGRIESRWLPAEPVARYEITMPLRGEYARIRAFVIEALRAEPSLSLDAVRLHRTGTDMALIDGELRWSLHVRPEAATAP